MGSTPGRRVDRLLSELCSRLGYCCASRNPLEFEALVPMGADAFARAVLASEGHAIGVSAGQVRQLVARHFEQWILDDGANSEI